MNASLHLAVAFHLQARSDNVALHSARKVHHITSRTAPLTRPNERLPSMDIQQLSDSWWFVVLAYVAAFAPWSAIANTDFITSTWRTVHTTRRAAKRNLFWTLVPAVYVILYSVVMGIVADYAEMCAAIIATVFALLLSCRTVWALWQMNQFCSWAERCILALDAMGIPYEFSTAADESSTSRRARDVVEMMLINDKVVDNQIMHGDVHCYLTYGSMRLLRSRDHDFDLLGPLYVAARWIVAIGAMSCDCILNLFGRPPRYKLKQVPVEPVEVWIHWACTFASQGLQSWISQFDVASRPSHDPFEAGKTAMQSMCDRGQYFGSEIIASACMHLWKEIGHQHAVSPMLWSCWDNDSDMCDGRVVKQELFKAAIASGECLPFTSPHVHQLEATSKRRDGKVQYGYEAYQHVLEYFVSELPVRSICVDEMRKFDIEMLEWLTIILHLGMLSRKLHGERVQTDTAKQLPESHCRDVRKASDFHQPLSSVAHGEPVKTPSKEAVLTLRRQVGLDAARPSATSLVASAMPIMNTAMSILSEGNRLVTKAGELVDVWMSLVCGDQLNFLTEKINPDWKRMCLGEQVENNCQVQGDRKEASYSLRHVHKQVEKKRLETRIAQPSHRYGYLDHFLTFMGYRMEIARTVIAHWVKRNPGTCGDDFFIPLSKGFACAGVTVEMSRDLISILRVKTRDVSPVLSRAVQCQTIWELQNCLGGIVLSFAESSASAACYNVAIATAMLMVLSFPGLHVCFVAKDPIASVSNDEGSFCISIREIDEEAIRFEKSNVSVTRKGDFVSVIIGPVCGPQILSIVLDIDNSGKCNLRMRGDGCEFKWRWWRDAFMGRLEGQQEWQEELGIGHLDVENNAEDGLNSTMVQMTTPLNSPLTVWREWAPFRTEFCRFELESEGLLKGSYVVGHKTPTVSNDKCFSYVIGRLPVRRIKVMRYDEADDGILKHSCLFVQETLRSRSRTQTCGEDQVAVGSNQYTENAASKLMDLAQSSDASRALVLYETAAIQHGLREALERSLEILLGAGYQHEHGCAQAASLIRTFVGAMVSTKGERVKMVDGEKDFILNVVFPYCERVLRHARTRDVILEEVSVVLTTCLGCDPDSYGKSGMLLMKLLVCLCDGLDMEIEALFITSGAVGCFESRNSPTFQAHAKNTVSGMFMSKEGHNTKIFLLEKAIGRYEGTLRQEGNQLRENSHRLSCTECYYKCMTRLGWLYSAGHEEFADNPKRAEYLFTKAIEEANDVYAMINLGWLMEVGPEGIQADAKRAMELYERAIREGSHVYAMNNLGVLLQHGATGVKANPKRAKELFERAIKLGGHTKAMTNLGMLLHSGADDVEPNPKRAVELYERAIEEGRDIYAMNNLAVVLESGADGVAVDPRRAVELYEMAISEGDDADAMYNLGMLLKKGAQGLKPDATRSAQMLLRAVEDNEDVDAMIALAHFYCQGVSEVKGDPKQGKLLLRRAVCSGRGATDAFDALGDLWKWYARGSQFVEQDVQLAKEIQEYAEQFGIALS